MKQGKAKTAFACDNCDAVFGKWFGQCPECLAWDSVKEQAIPSATAMTAGYSGIISPVQPLSAVNLAEAPRIATGMAELDRVLGGGLVPGSVVLIGGDPGIGKSTCLLQVCCLLSRSGKILYVTGEESPRQIAMRAERLGLPGDNLLLMTETQVENICLTAAQENPRVMVIDSIQTMQTAAASSTPGSVSQVRESAAQLTQFAKTNNIAVFLVGHVTKSGDLAGPRVLEHIIDVVCYFEGGGDSRYRMMRAVKNRYGAVNELGVFAMTDRGLKEITNPSAIFLSRAGHPMAGSAVMALWEGSRPLLVEVQSLVDESHGESPRRLTVGIDQNRLIMLLAVLHRHGGIASYNRDVFINVVGGVKVNETSADLALLLAIASSIRDTPLPGDLLVFGEIGLAGEIRPVPHGQERLKEAAKHGFCQAIVPKANQPPRPISGMQVLAVEKLTDALAAALATPPLSSNKKPGKTRADAGP
ncbi:MAG: DNA repair protein RadA [Thermodesulfobacteriota bacterium]